MLLIVGIVSTTRRRNKYVLSSRNYPIVTTFRMYMWHTRCKQETRGQTQVTTQTCVSHHGHQFWHEIQSLVSENVYLRKCTRVRLVFQTCPNFVFTICNAPESAVSTICLTWRIVRRYFFFPFCRLDHK